VNERWEGHSEEWKAIAEHKQEEWFDPRRWIYDDRDGQYYPHGKALCPMCGHELGEWEGTIDQTEQGNDITGHNFFCPECDWESKTWTL